MAFVVVDQEFLAAIVSAERACCAWGFVVFAGASIRGEAKMHDAFVEIAVFVGLDRLMRLGMEAFAVCANRGFGAVRRGFAGATGAERAIAYDLVIFAAHIAMTDIGHGRIPAIIGVVLDCGVLVIGGFADIVWGDCLAGIGAFAVFLAFLASA